MASGYSNKLNSSVTGFYESTNFFAKKLNPATQQFFTVKSMCNDFLTRLNHDV
jgi:hypothetical protein